VRRREFLSLLGSAPAAWPIAAWPVAARAQQAAMPPIGLLSGVSSDEHYVAAVRKGLGEEGFAEGRNVAIEYRSGDGHYERLPALAADLVRRQVAVILAVGGTASALAAKTATTRIPIVFSHGGDAVRVGLVASLNRPDGNVTGVTFLVNELGTKRLELLRELVPAATVIGCLGNTANPNFGSELADLETAARLLGQQLYVQNAPDDDKLDVAIAGFVHQRVHAVLVSADAFFLSRRVQLAALTARHSLPAMYAVREHALAGGLVSYGTDRTDAYRQAGAGRILKGERPADLPVMRSTKFEFVLNLATAKALGLSVPDKLLALADEVIE